MADLFKHSGCVDICGITPDIPEAARQFSRRKPRSAEDDEYEDDEYEDDEDGADDYESEEGSIDDDDVRIVNGYRATSRPWLVKIENSGGLCGGAILNDR